MVKQGVGKYLRLQDFVGALPRLCVCPIWDKPDTMEQQTTTCLNQSGGDINTVLSAQEKFFKPLEMHLKHGRMFYGSMSDLWYENPGKIKGPELTVLAEEIELLKDG